MNKEDNKLGPSRFQKHLHIMEIEHIHPDPKGIKQEQDLIDKMEPIPLNLQAFRKPSIWEGLKELVFSRPAGVLLASACALFFMVYQLDPEDESSIRSKGSTQVKLYYELEKVVKPFNPKVPLPAGSRVQVEIMPAKNGAAYLNVVDKNNKALLSRDYILSQALEVKAGQKTSFADSLQLTGPSEGETLSVMLCNEGVIADFKEWNSLLDIFYTKNGEQELEGCEVFKFKLR